jgi:hypothetical protein
MRLLPALAFLVPLASPAAADALSALTGGKFGATEGLSTCALNPHVFGTIPSPPHVVLTWTIPLSQQGAAPSDRAVYDLLSADGDVLTLRREGENLTGPDGAPAFHLLRRTTNPDGYCWGRTDWPVIRCEEQQVRCDTPAPVS